jgi:predicted HicB family RNase H-like nuclease
MATNRKPLTFDVDRGPPPLASGGPPARAAAPDRQQVGARITKSKYRRLKARAAMQGVTVQTLVEQAIDEFLASHPD